NESGVVVGLVLDASANDPATVEIGGALTRYRGTGGIGEANDLRDTAGSVVGYRAFYLRVVLKKATALRERDRVRLHSRNRIEDGSRAADQVLFDLDFNFVEYGERTRAQEIDSRLNDAGDRVFDGREQIVSHLVVEAGEKIVEGLSRHELDFAAKQLQRSLFAEGPALALKCDSWFSNQSGHLKQFLIQLAWIRG